MKVNAKKTRRLAVLLGLVMMLSVVLAACVNTDNVPEILDSSREIVSGGEIVSESSEVLETPEGATEAPVVAGVVNIEPTKVAVYGTCEENATIRVTGGETDVEIKAHGTYFVAEVDIWNRDTLLLVTAQIEDELDEAGEVVKEGKEESLPREVVARKDATADVRLDGNSVSVGVDSRLYFDKMVADAIGENLYTASELNKIKNYISSTVSDYYYTRAKGQAVELIYVLVPNVTTMYPEILPEDELKDTNTTIYEQVLNTISQTNATCIDMKPIFEAALADEALMSKYGGVYRETDSSLSDFGGYLTYKAIMTQIASRFPDAAPHTEEEFTWNTVEEAMGGNLVNYRGLDGEVITESIVTATPNFSLDFGSNGASTAMISKLQKYVDPESDDYNFFIAAEANDSIWGIAERWDIHDQSDRLDTYELPSAVVYRDYASLSFCDYLAERFGRCRLSKSGELSIDLTSATQYADGDDEVVDYIIVILSEENMDTAFANAFPKQ
ncbi:MAG: hypothetical protein IKK70_00685 [Clostridia bacterium]|nr:hypothetical protein [Clostridia bacterium]